MDRSEWDKCMCLKNRKYNIINSVWKDFGNVVIQINLIIFQLHDNPKFGN